MGKLKIHVFLLLFLFLAIKLPVLAQDQVYMKNAPEFPIYVKIVEIGLNQIKYKSGLPNSSETVYTEDKKNIQKVVLQNGTLFYFNSINSVESKENHSKNAALKTEFLSQLFGTSTFSYEKWVQKDRSIEFTIGLIGMGISENNNDGYYLKGGYKLYRNNGLKTTNSEQKLDGFYLKPEVVFSLYNQKNDAIEMIQSSMITWNEFFVNYKNVNATYEYSSIGIIASLGWSKIIKDIWVVDTYLGLGMGVSNKIRTRYSEELQTQNMSRTEYNNKFNRVPGDKENMVFGSGLLSDKENGLSVLFQLGVKMGILINQ
ncbi:MAG: hypothetical protein MH472_08235 [Bacteroidia bacterium]|nr:hypothetical protein [Bacteroidia bacterium]